MVQSFGLGFGAWHNTTGYAALTRGYADFVLRTILFSTVKTHHGSRTLFAPTGNSVETRHGTSLQKCAVKERLKGDDNHNRMQA